MAIESHIPENPSDLCHNVQEKDGEFRKLMAQIESKITTLTAYRNSFTTNVLPAALL